MGHTRVKECQRGSAYAAESAKERHKGAAEGSDTRLGPGDRAFESHYSDQKHAEIVDFSVFFYIKSSDFLCGQSGFLGALNQVFSLIIAAQNLRRSGMLLRVLEKENERHYTEMQEICKAKVWISDEEKIYETADRFLKGNQHQR